MSDYRLNFWESQEAYDFFEKMEEIINKPKKQFCKYLSPKGGEYGEYAVAQNFEQDINHIIEEYDVRVVQMRRQGAGWLVVFEEN